MFQTPWEGLGQEACVEIHQSAAQAAGVGSRGGKQDKEQ